MKPSGEKLENSRRPIAPIMMSEKRWAMANENEEEMIFLLLLCCYLSTRGAKREKFSAASIVVAFFVSSTSFVRASEGEEKKRIHIYIRITYLTFWFRAFYMHFQWGGGYGE